MSRAQAAAVRTVGAGLPAELVLLPTYRPAVVRDAILTAVSGRTPEQIVERVNRRWIAWGYFLKATDGEIERPVGVLVRLLEHSKCSGPLCEDGTALDAGAACRDRARAPGAGGGRRGREDGSSGYRAGARGGGRRGDPLGSGPR